MKLLTLNIHGVIDELYELKINALCDFIIKYKPDVIALQEVMQPCENDESNLNHKICTIGNVPVKDKNLLIELLLRLEKHKVLYHCIYLSLKKAYGIYDEGICLLTKKEISFYELVQLSDFNNYDKTILYSLLIYSCHSFNDIVHPPFFRFSSAS